MNEARSNTKIRRLTLRSGMMMFPRDSKFRQERVKKDHTVLAMATNTPEGGKGWSFLRGGSDKNKWFVRADDVDDRDFPDHPDYIDTGYRGANDA